MHNSRGCSGLIQFCETLERERWPMGKVLVVDDDPALHQVIEGALVKEGHALLHATDGVKGMELLAREKIDLAIIDYLMPAIDEHSTPKIEVISAEPHWVQLRVPCDLAAVPILQKLLTQLKADLPEDTREAIAYAFREMLNNAIEHGGKLDPTKYVEVLCVLLKRAIIYWIKDPGEGFDPSALEHAAVNNPAGDPFRHVSVRDEKGLRAGGFGILMADQLVDELVYNERRNEVMFVKYL